MLNEIKSIQSNAKKILENEKPKDTLIYIFISEQNENQEWENNLIKYTEQFSTGEYKLLDTGHYAHHEQSEIIVEDIKKFLSK